MRNHSSFSRACLNLVAAMLSKVGMLFACGLMVMRVASCLLVNNGLTTSAFMLLYCGIYDRVSAKTFFPSGKYWRVKLNR